MEKWCCDGIHPLCSGHDDCPVCRTARTLAAIRFLGGEAPDKLVRRHEMQGLIETGAVTIGFLVRLILPLLLLLLYSSWVERQAA